jgi:hypothetical protein
MMRQNKNNFDKNGLAWTIRYIKQQQMIEKRKKIQVGRDRERRTEKHRKGVKEKGKSRKGKKEKRSLRRKGKQEKREREI